MTVLVPPVWSVLDQKRCAGRDALRLENDAALFRIDARQQRLAGRKHTAVYKYRVQYLTQCIEQQMADYEVCAARLHETYSRIFADLQQVYQARVRQVHRTQSNDQLEAKHVLQREYQHQIAEVNAAFESEKEELLRQASTLTDRVKEHEAHIAHLEKKAADTAAEVTALTENLHRGEAKVKEKEEEMDVLRHEMTRSKRRDDKELSVRDDIWKKKLEIWEKAQEQEQAQWAEEKIDLQVTIAKLESRIRSLSTGSGTEAASELVLGDTAKAALVTAPSRPKPAKKTEARKPLKRATPPSEEGADTPASEDAVAPPRRATRSTEASPATRKSPERASTTSRTKPTAARTPAQRPLAKKKPAKTAKASKMHNIDEAEEESDSDPQDTESQQADRQQSEEVAKKKRRMLVNPKERPFNPFNRKTSHFKADQSDSEEESSGHGFSLSSLKGDRSTARAKQRANSSIDALLGKFAAQPE